MTVVMIRLTQTLFRTEDQTENTSAAVPIYRRKHFIRFLLRNGSSVEALLLEQIYPVCLWLGFELPVADLKITSDAIRKETKLLYSIIIKEIYSSARPYWPFLFSFIKNAENATTLEWQ